MRTIRNFFAVMLMGLAFSAFQVDAQSRGGESRSNGASRSASRSTSTSRSSSSSVSRSSQSRSSSSAVQSRPSSSVQRQSSSSVQRSSSAQRPSSSVQRPSSSQKPSSAVQNRPASQNNNRPSRTSGQTVQARPVSPNGPASSVGRPSGSSNRPAAQVRPTAPSRDVKPSNTVQRPADRPAANRPGYRPGDKKPAHNPAVRPDQRPSQRPGAGSAFKPDHKRPPVQIRPDHRHDRPRVHPIHRDFIAFDRPSCYWSAHHHYFGHRVRVLPARARLYRHHGIAYYCYNDIWYRPYGGYYVICRPPFGTVLAANIIKDIAWTAVRISYYNTVANSYRTINENNEYIAQQNAIIAQNNATIAAQNKTMAMNQAQANAAYSLANELGLVQSYAAADSEYFYQDGVFYAKAANGEYNVIVPPAGALVESLPEDYDMVTLGGNEYYKVDETVYKVTLSEGKPYFEVLGQMYS